MEKYACSKVVDAARIADIIQRDHEQPGFLLKLDPAPGLWLDHAFVYALNPEIGGYIVCDADGSLSYSSAEAFKENYTKLED